MKARSAQARKRAVSSVLNRLSSSLRGQIFLCNLDASIKEGLVDPNAVTKVLSNIVPRSINNKHENNLLGYLRSALQSPTSNLLLKNDRSADLPNFSNGKPLITVMKRSDFEGYYADPADLISGHDFSHRVPGASTTKFRPSAETNSVCWVAPTDVFTDKATFESNAEAAKDTLGLVHYGKKIDLVALLFTPPPRNCFRPTAIESIPNARFRQTSLDHPSEKRWGFTVNLELLDKALPTGRVSGVPELVFSKLKLKDCTVSKFFHLGTTITDRDTSQADDNFLSHLLQSDSIDKIIARLKKELSP